MAAVAEEFIDEEAYRDSIATVDENGKRIWLYPKKPKGNFFNKRVWATIGFLTIFISGPFIKIGGQPLLMMNFFDRKFIIFGQIFLPHDFVLFGIGMLIFVIFIALFTVTYGRIWCGWLCPQTVFMEMVFRPIEYWLEGDARQQKKFDEAPWDFNKVWRKGLKHLIFVVFSVFIAHITMAYLIGIEGVQELITQSPMNNLSGFTSLVAFTVVFYYVFAKLREQVCVAICPYGRLQGVLVNRDTMTVIYDFIRGEPRGRLKKNAAGRGESSFAQSANDILVPEAPKGDCIDCNLCVQVCPTGIDIRNGIQMECVNCTACIDACDDVMVKIDKPKGLIRYASVESVEKNEPFKISKRSMAYSFVLVVLIALEAVLLINRSAIETTVMRVPGQLYQENDDKITNLYNAQLINKTNETKTISVTAKDERFTVRFVGKPRTVDIAPSGREDIVFFIETIPENLTGRKTDVVLEVKEGDEVLETIATSFLGPN
jgi:cytochrome c oxidase accessory protein FixG